MKKNSFPHRLYPLVPLLILVQHLLQLIFFIPLLQTQSPTSASQPTSQPGFPHATPSQPLSNQSASSPPTHPHIPAPLSNRSSSSPSPSSHLPISLPHIDSSQNQPTFLLHPIPTAASQAPLTVKNHPMITRSKDGIFQPKALVALPTAIQSVPIATQHASLCIPIADSV